MTHATWHTKCLLDWQELTNIHGNSCVRDILCLECRAWWKESTRQHDFYDLESSKRNSFRFMPHEFHLELQHFLCCNKKMLTRKPQVYWRETWKRIDRLYWKMIRHFLKLTEARSFSRWQQVCHERSLISKLSDSSGSMSQLDSYPFLVILCECFVHLSSLVIE